MERSIHDSLCVVKRVLESNMVVPGGGAVETALSVYLENFATSIVSASSLWCYVHTCVCVRTLCRSPESSSQWLSLPIPFW